MSKLPHNCFIGLPKGSWEVGTRDTEFYALFTEVVAYLINSWALTTCTDHREKIIATGIAIQQHEKT